MRSGEGNENGEKTTIGLTSKKPTFHVQYTFSVHFFTVVLHDYYVKIPETSWLHVLWRNCRKCSCSLFVFSLSLIFTLVTASISHFLTAATKFHVVHPTKKVSFAFPLSLYLFFSLSFAGLSPYFLFFSVFLFLYIRNFWTWQLNLSLILSTTRIQKCFPLSVFVFIDSLVVSASQEVGGHIPSHQNNLTSGIGLHELCVRTVARAYATS